MIYEDAGPDDGRTEDDGRADEAPDEEPGGARDEEPGHDGDRRDFLNVVVGASAAAVTGAMVYPLGLYLVPPEVTESTSNSVTLALSPDDIRPNTGQIFKFGSLPGILIKDAAGELLAFSAVCTHLACTVQYRPDLSHIWCACHNGHYDLNGRNIQGPPPSPLAKYAVNVQGGQIVISKEV
jgi:Rieske Fe-S protein